MEAKDAYARETVRLLLDGESLLLRIGDTRCTNPEPGRPSGSIGFEPGQRDAVRT